MSWVDCGINLLSSQFPEREQALNNALPQVNRFVLIACDVAESEQLAKFNARVQGCIGTAGVHPHHADQTTSCFAQRLRELAEQESVRAIGECGLDYNRNFSAPKRQREVFAEQVALAVELELPLYLHERDALVDQLAILNEHQGQLPPLFVHCFTQGPEALAAYQELDAYIGITGWVCDERRGEDLRQAVPLIKSNRLLLETDAPYLLPRSLRPKPKSRVNEPRWLAHIAETVAQLRQVEIANLATETTANALRLFGEWPTYTAVNV